MVARTVGDSKVLVVQVSETVDMLYWSKVKKFQRVLCFTLTGVTCEVGVERVTQS